VVGCPVEGKGEGAEVGSLEGATVGVPEGVEVVGSMVG